MVVSSLTAPPCEGHLVYSWAARLPQTRRSPKPQRATRIESTTDQRNKQQLSRIFEAPDLSIPGEPLSPAEADFFVEHGFLVKHRLLDPDRVAAAMDQLWAHTLDQVPIRDDSGWTLDRDDRASWLNPQWAPMAPHPDSGPYQGRQPIEHYGRIVKLHDIGNADYVLALLPNDPSVRAVAAALLDDDLKASTQTRGVYMVFPTRNPEDPDGRRRLRGASLGPHTDQVCQQLNACAYLDDVRPRNGGFTIYPGSHRLMFHAHRFEANWSPLPSYDDALREVIETIEPVELVADGGAVIFWHGRSVHSVGIHIGEDIRWAAFADFTQRRDVLSDDEHRECGQYEWFKDAKLFREDHPVGPDMWRNWKVG